MICLKNRTFAVSQTTLTYGRKEVRLLWFAWKIVLLQYRKQQYALTELALGSCDLLEKSYFCSIANNRNNTALHSAVVVICLKNRTFAVSQTTFRNLVIAYPRLWFAWKIVLLQYRKQPPIIVHCIKLGCDLLEKSYFCSIANNVWAKKLLAEMVVICLKNRTFAVSQTTITISSITMQQLWFAWKIVLLQYRKQHLGQLTREMPCCDLLEKSYFCSIANNMLRMGVNSMPVVICLKNRTFAVSQTTF